ncbi:MAG: hypothetical protein IJ166_03650 [Prevotella sp.]|nr:hypothetical protein [Prevotella sp.]
MKNWKITLIMMLLINGTTVLLQSCEDKKISDSSNVIKMEVDVSFDTSRRVGVGGEPSPQWKKSDSLSVHASTNDLIRLASKHEDKIERLIAFRALLMKNPHEAVNFAIAEIEDTTIVYTRSGCLGADDRMSNVRIKMIQSDREDYKVTKEDSARLDSTFLFSDNVLKFYYFYDLCHKLPAKPEYERRLRQLYKYNKEVLIALARYHREEDKQEIIRLFSEIGNKDLRFHNDTIRTLFDAVAVWPSPSFKQQVRHVCQKIFEENAAQVHIRNAFDVLVAYNDRWSYNFIDKTLSKAKLKEKCYFDFCWDFQKAYEDNPRPLFKPLIKKYPVPVE